MAQVIKHRRGIISNVKSITTRNGELIVASGSVNDLSGPFVFIGSPNTVDEGISGAYKSISKIYSGNTAPDISAATYGSILDGIPFYASSNKSLYILGNDGAGGNTRLDLSGNLEGRTISNLTVTALTGSTAVFSSITGSFSGSFTGIASNAISSSYAATASYANDFIVAGTLTAQTIIAQTITSSIEFITGSTRNGSLLTNTHQFTGSVLITGSLAINGVDYASTSASFETRILNNSASIAQLSGSYLASSASFDTRILNNSGSIALLSGSFLSVSGSNSTRITSLELFSSSLDNTYATDAELNSATASLSGSIAALSSSYLASSASFDTRILNNSSSVALLSGSFLTVSGSNSGRISSLESFTGSYATTGSNVFKGSQTISGSVLITDTIQGTGSIFLQPDSTDSRKLEIYNTSVSDVHIKATGGQTFLGDDSNFVEINDSLQTINVTAVNGVYITGIASTIGDFSSSVDSRFSASVASVTTLSSSVDLLSGSLASFKGSYNTGSFTGSFIGDGNGLFNIPASGVVGLELNRIASGSATASISPVDGFRVNTKTEITGSAIVTGSLAVIGTISSSTLNTNGLLFGNGSNIITSMTAPSASGQFAQWNGSAWAISNVIDGGGF